MNNFLTKEQRKCNVIWILATLLLIVCFFAALIFAFSPESVNAATSSPNFHSGSRADDCYDYLKYDGVWYLIAKTPRGTDHGQLYAAGLAVDKDKVVIPSYLEYQKQKYDVLGVNDWGFYGESSIKTLVVQTAYIGENAFYNCSGIKSVSFSEGLTEVGPYAFYGCSSLESVVLPDKLKTVGKGMFASCTSLKSVTLGKGTKVLDEAAFYLCESLKTVKLNKGLTTISERAFNGCKNLKSIKLPAKLTKLGNYAFSYCESLESIKIPKKVIEIPDNCFEWCKSLKKIKLPSGLKKIGSGAFNFCDELTTVSGTNKKLTYIGTSAFASDVKLSSINISKVMEIGSNAFSGTAISKVEFSSKLTAIGANAFSNTKFTTITLPGSLKVVSENAFSNCSELRKVVLESGVERVEYNAFYNCQNLSEFIYPDTIKYIAYDSLKYTDWLEREKGKFLETSNTGSSFYTYYKDGHYDFSKIPEAISINDVCIWIDEYERYIGEFGYWVQKDKETVKFPKNCRVISVQLGIKSGTKNVVIPEGVELMEGYINFGSVENDPSIDVVLPSTLKELNCHLKGTQLTSVTLPSKLEKLGKLVFSDAEFLTEVKFTGNKLKTIGDGAFRNTKRLSSIELPDGIEEIEMYAFYNSGIQKIVLPETLKKIGDFAFSGTGIQTFTLPNNIEEISYNAFDNGITIVVKKNSTTHKTLLHYFEIYGSDQFKIKFK